MNAQIKGKCFQVGNAATVYQIISRARWKEHGRNVEKLGDWVFEKLAPGAEDKAGAFRALGYSIVIAGGNFGCGGKSNDHPLLALKGAGIELVIAESFSRIFFRNAVNLGLYVMPCPNISSFCSTDDIIECDLGAGTVKNLTKGTALNTKPLTDLALDILGAGSLVDYYKKVRDKPELLFAGKR